MLFDRVEGHGGFRRVVHRQDHAGQDLHPEHERKDGAEGPPVVQVARRRIGHERGMHETQNRQAPFDPLQGGMGRLVVGWSAHDAIPREIRRRDGSKSRTIGSRDLADLDFAIGNEFVGRHRQIGRRGSLANATGGVVLRAVAGAEEAVVIALMGDRDAAEMGADADHDQPLVMAFLDPGLVGLPDRAGSRPAPGAPRRSASWCGGMM